MLRFKYRLWLFADRLFGLLIRAVFALLRRLGPDRGPRIGAFLARHLGPLTGANRIARENIAAAFPEKSAAERAAILMEAWDNLGRVACEYVHMDRIWDFDLDRPMDGRITATPEAWHIGAAVPLTNILERLGGEFPALQNMLWWFGSRQIRNRATLGGNLVTASPIGDSAPVLLTSETQLILASAEGERTLPLAEFFLDYRQTALRPGEVLKTIVLPRDDGFRRMFYKASKRREMDISTVAGCFAFRKSRPRPSPAVSFCASRRSTSR